MLPKQVQSDMTLFNLVETDSGVDIQTTVLKQIYWNGSYGISFRVSLGIDNKDRIFVMIPIDVEATDGREYIDTHQFKKLPAEERKKYWTLSKRDRMVNQVVDKQYEKPIDIEKDLGLSAVVTITEVGLNVFGSKHLQHYAVTGR